MANLNAATTPKRNNIVTDIIRTLRAPPASRGGGIERVAERLNVNDLGARGRAVVIATHPNDEVFALGGTMALLEWAGFEVEVVAVTDGECSHPNSTRITPSQLRELRCEETLRAYRCMGIHPQRYRLGLPDSEVAAHADALVQILSIRAHEAALIFAPLETDGNADNDAVGVAARQVAIEAGVPLWRYAVWAQMQPERISQEGAPGEIWLPSEIQARKLRATAVFSSQLTALGPAPADGPALPANFRQHFITHSEPLWLAS